MRFDSADRAAVAAGTRTSVVTLLDAAFGFGVWALHLLIIYVSTAVACQLELGSKNASVRSSVLIALIAITLVAAAVVTVHAAKRYRMQRHLGDRGFLARLAVADDALALLAILWQLMPITMVPLCR